MEMKNQIKLQKNNHTEDVKNNSLMNATEDSNTSTNSPKESMRSTLNNENKKTDDRSDDFSTGDADEGEIKIPEVTSNVKTEEIEKAKQKLSKWSLRLFDPNRPKGPVEPPSIIPLNDEFITAFGKREKAYDESIGRTLDVDRENLDTIEIDSDDEEDPEQDLVIISQQKGGSCKIKISNLAYTTSQKVIEEQCEKFGPTIDVNLLMDMEKALRNSTIPMSVGRAYVTFLDAESASKCVEALDEKLLDGRIVRVRLVNTKIPFKSDTQRSKSQKRYWEKDISTKCFRCRRIGHTEAECTYEEKPRPCLLCGSIEHQHRHCPLSTICFNCGVPGHVSRNCILPKGMPRRIVCTYCYKSGHHRMACRNTCPNNLFSHAKCISCVKNGHFVCFKKDYDWISRHTSNVYCFNCGAENHIGYDCKRPKVGSCSKDTEVSVKEVERAWGLTDDRDEISDRSQGSKRGRPVEDNYQQSKRAKSAPLPSNQRRNSNSYRDEEPSLNYQNKSYSSRNRGYSDRNDSQSQSYSNKNNDRDRNNSSYSRSEKVSNYTSSGSSRRNNNSRGYR